MRSVMVVAVVALLAAGAWYLARSPGSSAPSHEEVEIGRAVSGELTATDQRLRNRGNYQLWTLRGKKGQRLVIEMASSAFDSYLILRTPEGYLIGADDDGGGGNNARLRTVLPANGAYTLVAGSFGSGMLGAYTVTVSEWIVPEAPEAGSVQDLSVGETKDGMLEPGDELTGDGPYQDRWTVQLAESSRVRVTMSSSDMDSYLILQGPDGVTISTNDDASGRDAAIRLRATTAGRYTVLATTFGDQPRVGAYRIGLEEVTGTFGVPGAAVSIAFGETKDGQLEEGDSSTMSGSLADVYTFRAPTTRMVQIDLVATEFDPYLTFQDSLGMTLRTDDDGGGSLNSRITIQAMQGQLYRIVVGTYGSSRRSGAYRLGVNPGGF